ncbi:MAG: PAS domain S-box protein, partial [Bacteroidales bacterium]|nr:PAS domain S-box protein [Bacteroidales bacterium]
MLSKSLHPKVPYAALATIAGIITTIVGLLVLIGSQFDIGILKSILLGAVPMKANTAAAFLLSGVALLLIQRPVTANKALVRFFAVIITLTGFLTLCQYLFSWNFGIDELLFRDSGNVATASHPGRMSPDTALNFIFIGSAFYILTLQKYRNKFLIGFSLFLALTISGIDFLGYVSGFIVLSALAYTKMAMHTSITFIILCLGMLSVAYKRQPEKITIEQKTLAGLTISIAIIISLALLSVSAIRSLRQVNRELEYAQNTKQLLYLVQSGVIDLKVGERGYLISGDEKYLEPVIKAKEKLPKLLDELTLLTRNEPRQQESLVSLNQLIKERVDYAELLYDTYKTKGEGAGIALFSTGRGWILTDSIRAIIAKMLEEEDRNLKIQNEAALQKTNETLVIVYMGIGVQILLFLFIFLIIRKDVIGRRKAESILGESEETIKKMNIELEQRVTERTAELKRAYVTLRESEENLWSLLASMDDLVFSLDKKGIFQNYYQPSHEGELIMPPVEFIGKHYKAVLPPTVVEKLRVAIEEMETSGKTQHFEYELEINESKKWYEATLSSIRGIKGDIAGITAVVRDITKRKKAEETLRESEEKYRNLVERASDGIIIIQDGIIKFANQQLVKMWGGTTEEIIGTSFINHLHAGSKEELVDRYRRRMAGDEVPTMYEVELQRKDGSKLYAELNAGVTLYEGKSADFVIIRDITER